MMVTFMAQVWAGEVVKAFFSAKQTKEKIFYGQWAIMEQCVWVVKRGSTF